MGDYAPSIKCGEISSKQNSGKIENLSYVQGMRI